MAMNKKEQQMVEDLKIENFNKLVALKFTEQVEKDLDIPEGNGYSYNEYGIRVQKSCSSRMSHCSYGWDQTGTQLPIKQFSSQLLALKALRNAIEKKCAKELRQVDIMIENLLEV